MSILGTRSSTEWQQALTAISPAALSVGLEDLDTRADQAVVPNIIIQTVARSLLNMWTMESPSKTKTKTTHTPKC